MAHIQGVYTGIFIESWVGRGEGGLFLPTSKLYANYGPVIHLQKITVPFLNILESFNSFLNSALSLSKRSFMQFTSSGIVLFT